MPPVRPVVVLFLRFPALACLARPWTRIVYRVRRVMWSAARPLYLVVRVMQNAGPTAAEVAATVGIPPRFAASRKAARRFAIDDDEWTRLGAHL